MICTICLSELTGAAYSNVNQHGDLTLPCHQEHVFHGDCLYGAVQSAAQNATDTGYVLDDETVWVVTPPRCPQCRARFAVSGLWPDLAAADGYPDNGRKYTATQDLGDWDPHADESEEDSDEEDMDVQPPVQDQDEDQDHSSGSDSDEVWEDAAEFVCMVCQQNSQHVDYSSSYFMDITELADPTCHVCQVPIQSTDDAHVLVCENCQAVRHWHD